MKIGVIGSGVVGKTLAAGFVKHGHEVMLGTREPAKLAEWAAGAGMGVTIAGLSDTARFGELVVLAVKGSVAREVLSMIDATALSGKAVIDTSNPIDGARGPVNGVLHFTTNLDQSLMEELQAHAPDVHFVKAFNSVGSALMIDPVLESTPTMFICGNNDAAKGTVTNLLQQVGWEVCDMGKAEAARAIEPLCMLWCIPGFLRNEWTHAFKLLRA